ncbi:contractile injection system protein, VgrG/Pvc8 family [Acinetobacter sp. ANC 3791]|uniref:contractile injection system protein, VgrG/Pvc8 family n=1 Tax=Acinetobacter sp. ANC 3791 TaxID=2529836 RepID=UPI00103DB6BC|nr:contractile injection system protein, VgrG/Pvc8 family [Acinetobacter sp. ANC 3791]TCB86311.1 DNA primase [Acinetobacter sp. ANC 3791]
MNIFSLVKGEYASLAEYPTAIYRIDVNGINISSTLASRLISLNMQDNRGMVADSVDITLDDSDNILEIPSMGVELELWLGWSDIGLIYKGKFLVTSCSHSGAPDTLHIAAEANDLAEAFRQKHERSFHKKTVQEVFETIAFDYDLKVIVHPSIANRSVGHLDQNDSDANIMTRIADENDAIATVKNGTLLCMPIGESQTASGLDLPKVELTRTDGDQHNFSMGQSNNKVDAVKAYYHDKTKGEKQYVIYGSTTDNPKEVRFVHRDKKTAELAAKAEFNRCKRAEMALSYTLAKGRADLIPEQQITFVGLKPQIDEIVWLGKTITHDLSESSGYTTKVDLEIQLPNADDVSTLFDDTTKIEKEKKSKTGKGRRKAKNYKSYTGVKIWYLDGKTKLSLTKGDQTTPLILVRTYKTKRTAQTALTREYAKIQKAKAAK